MYDFFFLYTNKHLNSANQIVWRSNQKIFKKLKSQIILTKEPNNNNLRKLNFYWTLFHGILNELIHELYWKSKTVDVVLLAQLL